MKKILKVAAFVLVGVVAVCALGGSGLFKELYEKGKTIFGGGRGTTVANAQISRVNESKFVETPNKYQIVDSYIMDDGNYYYFYYLGAVDYVPLNLSSAEGVYFNGTEFTLKFTLSETNQESSEKVLKKAVENSVDLTTTSYEKTSISANMYSLVEANIEAGISDSATTSISDTFTESYSMAISKESTFEKSIIYEMGDDDPLGYYFYTAVASMKVYEIVVYNPKTEKIECMSTYSSLGVALPGLYYSPFSFLDYNDYEIKFDESKLPAFEMPIKEVSSNINVEIDPNGAACGISSLDLKIGGTYGSLPKVERKGYTFVGWYANGKKIEENSTVLTIKPIVAKWEIITKKVFEHRDTISVSATYKFNPFYIAVPGENGESSVESVDISEVFDFPTLKTAGYKMRIQLEYEANCNTLAVLGAKFTINFQSNNRNIYSVSEELKSTLDGGTSYVKKYHYSEDISLSVISGGINFSVSTENYVGVNIRNLRITIEFVK